MFDAHAHPGASIKDNALVCSVSGSEYAALASYKYRAAGTLALSGDSPDFTLMERYASSGFHIGEIGLDRRYPDEDKQEMIFRQALEIARRYDRLAIIHTVREYGKTLSILKEMKIGKFLLHGYTGSADMARLFIRLGGIISLGPGAERTRSFKALLTLPFVTETDMAVGEEEENVLIGWNRKLSLLTGTDTGERSERIMKEVLA